MITTKQDIAEQGVLLTERPVVAKQHEQLFIFQHYRVFFSKKSSSSPLSLEYNFHSVVPDYVIELVYRLVQTDEIFRQQLKINNLLQLAWIERAAIEYIDVYLSDIELPLGWDVLTQADIFNIIPDYLYRTIRISWPRRLQPDAMVSSRLFLLLVFFHCPKAVGRWFEQGLAAWSRSLIQSASREEYRLPLDRDDLKRLLMSRESAWLFWERLFQLYEQPRAVEQDISKSHLIHNIILGCQTIERQLKQEGRFQPDVSEVSALNDFDIFKALHTILEAQKNQEITHFLELVKPIVNYSKDKFQHNEMQQLLRVLLKINPNAVQKTKSGIFYSPFYEPETGTLSYPCLELDGSDFSNQDVRSFSIVKSISGDLLISNNPAISSLDGLRNIRFIGGKLLLENLGITTISEFERLRSAGAIEIKNNRFLKNISGFVSVNLIQDNLSILANPELSLLSGFNSLKQIRTGKLQLCNLPKLSGLNGFGSLSTIGNCLHLESCVNLDNLCSLSNLRMVGNIYIDILRNVADLRCLKGIFEHSPEFRGEIRIVRTGIKDITFMRNLKATHGSIDLQRNKIVSLEGLDNLVSVNGNFNLSANRIPWLKRLSKLERINGMLDVSKNKLITLNGLEGLHEIKNIRWEGRFRSLVLSQNERLRDIRAIENITVKGSNLVVLIDKRQVFENLPDEQSAFASNKIEVISIDYKTYFERQKVCAVADWSSFEEIVQCSFGVNCLICRNKRYGYAWRKKLSETLTLPPGGVDFKCPYGKPWSRFGYLTPKDDIFQLEPEKASDIEEQKSFAKNHSVPGDSFPEQLWGKKIDVVYPFLAEEGDCYEELRYSLRSLQNLYEKQVNVWIVGDKPDWLNLDTANYLPHKKSSTSRYIDSRAKVKLAAEHPQMGSHFIYMNDDLFLMRPVVTAFLGIPRYIADYTGRLDSFEVFYDYHQHELKGLQELKKRKLPLQNFNLHWPYVHNTENFLQMYEQFRLDEEGHNHETLYFNSYSSTAAIPYSGELLRINLRIGEEITKSNLPARILVLNIKENSLHLVKKILEENFPEPSRFEK